MGEECDHYGDQVGVQVYEIDTGLCAWCGDEATVGLEKSRNHALRLCDEDARVLGILLRQEEPRVLDDEQIEETIVTLLRAKRKTKAVDEELTKDVNAMQRELEEEYGEYGVVISDEYECEPGWEPDE